MRRRSFVLAVPALLASSAGCTGGREETKTEYGDLPGAETVEMNDDAFDPTVVHVRPGGTVTWENEDDAAYAIDAYQFHTESTGWSFTETVEPGESVSHTFEEEGQYDYTDFDRGEFNACGRVRVGNVSRGKELPCE